METQFKNLGHVQKVNMLIDQLAIEREEIKVLRDQLAEEQIYSSYLEYRSKLYKIIIITDMSIHIIMAVIIGYLL